MLTGSVLVNSSGDDDHFNSRLDLFRYDCKINMTKWQIQLVEMDLSDIWDRHRQMERELEDLSLLYGYAKSDSDRKIIDDRCNLGEKVKTKKKN